jgi:hypothetical protein
MEPQHPEAGAAAGSEGSPPALLALLAPDAVVDSLTGSTLTLDAAAAAAGAPPPDAPAAEPGSASASPAPLATASATGSAAAPVQAGGEAFGLAGTEAAPSVPAPPLPAETAAPVPFSPWQAPGPQEEAPLVLSIEGRRYAVADLPPDARELFEGIRLADRLLAQKGETCQQLRWGLDAFIRALGQQLRTVEPLPELVGAPDSRFPSGDGPA